MLHTQKHEKTQCVYCAYYNIICTYRYACNSMQCLKKIFIRRACRISSINIYSTHFIKDTCDGMSRVLRNTPLWYMLNIIFDKKALLWLLRYICRLHYSSTFPVYTCVTRIYHRTTKDIPYTLLNPYTCVNRILL